MVCYFPQSVFQGGYCPHTGEIKTSFLGRYKGDPDTIPVPCGQCIGCRLKSSMQWAIRMKHELQTHDEEGCFITLTYAPDKCPDQLRFLDVQNFLKRLRSTLSPRKIRFYQCGEYGENFSRPHFHVCLFGWFPPDRQFYKKVSDDCDLWTSPTIDAVWGKGFAPFGTLTFESAAYCARYVTKKVTGDREVGHYYTDVGTEDERFIWRQPERSSMSLKPGLGRDWIAKYFSDVYPSDHVVHAGIELPPPRYYDDVFKSLDLPGYFALKENRIDKAAKFLEDNSAERLFVREVVQKARFQQLVRGFENA